MATNMKVQTLARYLQEDFVRRMAGLSTAVVVGDISFDTDANPMIRVGTGVIGAIGALIKILPMEWPLALNIIGQAAPNYGSQSVIQVIREAGLSTNTFEFISHLLSTVAIRGARVEFYESANGTAPVAAEIVLANLKGTWLPDLQNGLLLSQ